MPRLPHTVASRLTAWAAAAIPIVASGCYSYLPVTTTTARVGTELRVTLSEQGAADLTRFLGPRATVLEGTLVAPSDTALALSVTTITRTTGVEETWPGDQVVIPRAAIATAETRRFARGRSLLLTAGIIAASAIVGAAIAAGEDVNRGGAGPSNPGRQ